MFNGGENRTFIHMSLSRTNIHSHIYSQFPAYTNRGLSWASSSQALYCLGRRCNAITKISSRSVSECVGRTLFVAAFGLFSLTIRSAIEVRLIFLWRVFLIEMHILFNIQYTFLKPSCLVSHIKCNTLCYKKSIPHTLSDQSFSSSLHFLVSDALFPSSVSASRSGRNLYRACVYRVVHLQFTLHRCVMWRFYDFTNVDVYCFVEIFHTFIQRISITSPKLCFNI